VKDPKPEREPEPDLEPELCDRGKSAAASMSISVFPDTTLGALRSALAAALGPDWQQPVALPDYHDGLDDCTLHELGIGTGSILAVADDSSSQPLLVQCLCTGGSARAPEPSRAVRAAPTPRKARGAAPPNKQLPFATQQAVANASQITDWLFISGSMAAQSKSALKALKIGYVLNCCERIPFALGDRTHNLLLAMPDQQTASIEPYLPEAFGN
jgi:hypothetical protein